jgi:hypothetical protein
MENLNKYYQLIERCIANLGVDPLQCRGKKPGSWTLNKGSIQVWVDIWYIERERRAYFQVMSPVMKLPDAGREELFTELLQINDRLFGVGFTLYKDTIWLKHIRETENLQESEIAHTLNRVGNYADQYDDLLKQKYQAEHPDQSLIGGSRAPSA